MGVFRTIVVEDDYAVQTVIRDVLKLRLHEPIIFHTADDVPLTREHACGCRGCSCRCADFLIINRDMPCGHGLTWVENQLDRGCRIPRMAVISEIWHEPEKNKARELGCAVFNKPFDVLAIDKWLEDEEKELTDEVSYAEWFL